MGPTGICTGHLQPQQAWQVPRRAELEPVAIKLQDAQRGQAHAVQQVWACTCLLLLLPLLAVVLVVILQLSSQQGLTHHLHSNK